MVLTLNQALRKVPSIYIQLTRSIVLVCGTFQHITTDEMAVNFEIALSDQGLSVARCVGVFGRTGLRVQYAWLRGLLYCAYINCTLVVTRVGWCFAIVYI